MTTPIPTSEHADHEARHRAPEEVLELALFETERILVGQEQMLERLLVCAVARGHCLLEGPPGLAKTLAAETMARVLDGSFERIGGV